MKKTLSILLFAIGFIFQSLFAQSSQFKNERRIYLLDVTLSMKGYDGAPNIYDDVIKALEADINSIADEETEIVVIPFQEVILETWKQKATADGKKAILNKIETYNNEKVTYTNICVPLKEVMNKYISSDRRNVLFLLTDGVQNATGYSKVLLIQLIKDWCDFASKSDAYAFYVMLTKSAQDKELIDAIKETCKISCIECNSTNGIDINFVELMPSQLIKFNIKDDANKKLRLPVICKKNVEVPEGIKLKLETDPSNFITVNAPLSTYTNCTKGHYEYHSF